MVNHRRDPDRDTDTLHDDEYERDVAELAVAAGHLREIGEQVDEAHRAAIAQAVARAVSEANRTSRAVSRRFYWISLAVTALVAVALSLPFSLFGYFNAQQAAGDAAQLRAGEQASSDVADARQSSLLVVRRDFTTANNALSAAGLTPVPDPGAAASAYQIAVATGEAFGTLRTIGELQKRGAGLPGVVAPDPASPEFPGPRDGSASTPG